MVDAAHVYSSFLYYNVDTNYMLYIKNKKNVRG